MTKLSWLAVGCVVVSAIAVACGGTTEKGPGGAGGSSVVSEGPVAEDQLAQKYADAICSNSGPCCQKYGFAYDQAKCSSSMRGDLEEELSEVAKVPGLTYDADTAGECVAWVKKIVSQCIVSEADVDQMQKTCSAVWKGSKAVGEACTVDAECAGAETDTVECDIQFNPQGGSWGACVKKVEEPPAKRGTKGDSCNSTCVSFEGGSECSAGTGGSTGSGPTPGPYECWVDDGLQCQTSTFTCVELKAEGQPCSWSDYCVTTAWCKSGTCVPKSPVGGDCEVTAWAGTCVDGAYCHETTHKCTALVGEGQPCTSSAQCSTSRCEGGKCIPRNVIVEDEVCSGASAPPEDPQPQ